MNDLRDERKHQDSDSGNVVITAQLDVGEIQTRKNKVSGSSLYADGGFEDKDFSILPGEPVYQVIANDLGFTQTRGKPLKVLSVLTRIFTSDTTDEEAISRIRFIGFAGGQGATLKNPGLSVKIASKLTVINYSRQTIPGGSFVFWTLPPREKPGGHRRITRPLLELSPYSPRIHNLSEYNISRILTEPGSNDGEDEPLKEGAKNFRQAEITMTLLGLHWLAKVGFIDINPVAFTSLGANIRNESKKNYNALSDKEKENIFENVAYNAGMKMTKRNSNVKYTISPDSKNPSKIGVDQYLLDLITAEKKNSLIFPFLENGKIPMGIKGLILQHQKAMKSDLFAAITATNHYFTNRIVGKAINVGSAGGEFEINMSHYSLKPC